ncbi:MAG TPA: gamma carbonic anhydrase family protein [Thermoplasmataceae archaeon]|nr:gamma carbonic anhydrase family protein [Thermoplasmatales archaeon AK]HLH86039.1 gamma carbonic anhydrase family protein [Thermoplasmataceae archaeon]
MQIEIGKNCYIAPTAVLIGNVKLSDDVIILDHAVIRGDLSQIVIGEGTNVQDNAVIHADPSFPVQVGSGVSIGHGSIVHGSTIEDDVIIGMGTTLLNGSHVGKGSVIGASSLVLENFKVPGMSLVTGVPGVIKRSDDMKLLEYARRNAQSYSVLREKYLRQEIERVTGSDIHKSMHHKG